MSSNFQGKIALVTGAGSGIGRATALTFAKAGCKVVVADIVEASGKETVDLIKEAGGEAFFIKVDVSLSADVKAMIDKTIEVYGQIDFAHNNAGIDGGFTSTIACTEEDWDRVININLKSVWLCMKYEIPHMLKRGSGVIVNTSSGLGLIGFPGFPAYVASKHGIIGLTRTAALECAKAGIRVNAVCPGPTRTPLFEHANTPELEAQTIAHLPLGRIGTPQEVAEAVVWLCSDGASFITGHALPVEGGYLAQ